MTRPADPIPEWWKHGVFIDWESLNQYELRSLICKLDLRVTYANMCQSAWYSHRFLPPQWKLGGRANLELLTSDYSVICCHILPGVPDHLSPPPICGSHSSLLAASGARQALTLPSAQKDLPSDIPMNLSLHLHLWSKWRFFREALFVCLVLVICLPTHTHILYFLTVYFPSWYLLLPSICLFYCFSTPTRL